GLAYAEVTRADVSISAFVGIHNELVVALIDALASEAQRDKWLDGLRSFKKLGCFALTEPDHGSDIAAGLATTAQRTQDGWGSNGQKRWIGAGTFADFAICFARDIEDNAVKGFIVEMDRSGETAGKISVKLGWRLRRDV